MLHNSKSSKDNIIHNLFDNFSYPTRNKERKSNFTVQLCDYIMLSVLVALLMVSCARSLYLWKSLNNFWSCSEIRSIIISDHFMIEPFKFFLLNMGSCINSSAKEGRSYIDTFVTVSNCNFERTQQYTGSGGVIYVNSVSFSMYISCSMFFRCSCSSDGGAIYFESHNSTMKMVCSKMCFASYCHFACIKTTYLNIFDQISYSMCSYIFSGNLPINMYNGIQQLMNLNSSLNHAKECSGLGITYPMTFYCSHCTFFDNKVEKWNCLGLYDVKGALSYTNIISNNSPTYGVIDFNSGYLLIHNSVFDMNNGILFLVRIGCVELNHCYVSHIGVLSGSSPVKTSLNNSFTKIETFNIEFLGSKYCILEDQENTEPSKGTRFPNIILFVFLISIILLLFVFGLKNRRIASVLLERNILEENLQREFG